MADMTKDEQDILDAFRARVVRSELGQIEKQLDFLHQLIRTHNTEREWVRTQFGITVGLIVGVFAGMAIGSLWL